MVWLVWGGETTRINTKNMTIDINEETDRIVLEIKLPVPVKELATISDALGRIHGKDKLFMRQVGPMLQIFKPTGGGGRGGSEPSPTEKEENDVPISHESPRQ